MNVPSQSSEVVIALLGAEVSRAQDMLDFSWNQQVLELHGQTAASVRDVKVPEY